MNIKVTTPNEMLSIDRVKPIVEKLEALLKKQPLNYNTYHVVLPGSYDYKLCYPIRKIYEEAGWSHVVCNVITEGMSLVLKS